MPLHELKTDPGPFQAILDDELMVQIRKADRDYKQGDVLELRETRFTGEQMSAGKPLEYTGRWLRCIVTHVIHGTPGWQETEYGLKQGYVAMSILRATEA